MRESIAPEMALALGEPLPVRDPLRSPMNPCYRGVCDDCEGGFEGELVVRCNFPGWHNLAMCSPCYRQAEASLSPPAPCHTRPSGSPVN